jgi:hypothetical protein
MSSVPVSTVDVQAAQQRQWDNKETVQCLEDTIAGLADFLYKFESTTQAKLATLNERLARLEDLLDVVESKGLAGGPHAAPVSC